MELNAICIMSFDSNLPSLCASPPLVISIFVTPTIAAIVTFALAPVSFQKIPFTLYKGTSV